MLLIFSPTSHTIDFILFFSRERTKVLSFTCKVLSLILYQYKGHKSRLNKFINVGLTHLDKIYD